MTSRPLLAAVAALLLVTAGCLGTAGTNAATPADGPAESTISVGATGQVSAPPDLAVVRIAVVARADTADAARGAVATDADRVRGALSELDLPEDAVRTAYFAVYPEYDFRDGSRELLGYRAVHAFEIESGVDDAGAVIDAAVGNGADQVESVRFTLTDETRRELRAEALEDAMASARADADAIAAAGDLTVTGVRSVSTADAGVVPVYARTAEAGAGDASTTFDPGPVTVTANVQVVYAFE